MIYESEKNSISAGSVLKDHSLKVENRKKLCITGVTEVDGFDEHTVVLSTDYGVMTVHGNDLSVTNLNIDDGLLDIDGEISAIQYSTPSSGKGGGWMSKMFK